MNAGDAEVGMKSKGSQLQLAMAAVSGWGGKIEDDWEGAYLRKQNMVE